MNIDLIINIFNVMGVTLTLIDVLIVIIAGVLKQKRTVDIKLKLKEYKTKPTFKIDLTKIDGVLQEYDEKISELERIKEEINKLNRYYLMLESEQLKEHIENYEKKELLESEQLKEYIENNEKKELLESEQLKEYIENNEKNGKARC